MANWEWRAEDGHVSGSPGREALYGRPPGTLDSIEAVLGSVHPDDRAEAAGTIERALQRPPGEDQFDAVEFRVHDPDGAVRWLRSQGRVTERDPATGRALRAAGVTWDITDRRRAEEERLLLAREVDHRAKNTLAVVQAALRLTPRAEVDAYARAVEGRVMALARAHTLLAEGRWTGAALAALVRAELAAFLPAPPGVAAGAGAGRAEVEGPPVTLAASAAQAVSMALHELATNATKHGALSVPGGRIALTWAVDAEAGALRLRWAESGGPPVAEPPARRGFGSRVVEATLRDQLGGTVERRWEPGGLVCEVALPLGRAVLPPGRGMRVPAARPGAPPALRGAG